MRDMDYSALRSDVQKLAQDWYLKAAGPYRDSAAFIRKATYADAARELLKVLDQYDAEGKK